MTALSSNEELDRYIYLVAGCVGEFWTRMCVAHLSDLKEWDLSRMVDLGVRFGKGLQLVNILRDLPRDLRNGRCYLPVAEPRCLLKAEAFTSFSVEYARWLDLAISYLESGWEYVLSIPSSQWRLRLACVWPIWIGLMTIASLRQANPLDGAARIKIERRQVYGVIVRSLLTGKSHAALTRHYRMLLNKARGTQSG